jgi:hypothetical protein
MAPTRMFQDASSTAEWQTRFGFFPVISRAAEAQLDDSILWRLIHHRVTAAAKGPFDVDAAIDCPRSTSQVESLLATGHELGMPFGFPPLAPDEESAMSSWLRSGAGAPPPRPPLQAAQLADIDKWEAFLNADDSKSRIVARYLFEHLFLAHLQFDGAPGTWFRLVRSRTAAPASIDVISTVRPYDDPGAPRVYYRFRRITESIVLKTHVPYRLNDAKLAHLRQLFLAADWGGAALEIPSYERDVAANPFVAFRAIPARARYQFLLDDALYHVQTFIHGPVCKGQVALDVIDEHFLIFFLAPGADASVTTPGYLSSVAGDLEVPAEGGDGVEAVYARFKLHELSYLKAQGNLQRGARGRRLADVWDGDGSNRDAVLTVYRHFDSAFVVPGAVGGVPKTAWVLDYPTFERIYYDLVAGFDVFGSVVHQISTRRYMNLLRIESENQFLRFLPASQRRAVRASWYRGTGVASLVDVMDPFYGGPDSEIAFRDPGHAKEELVQRLLTETLPPQVVGPREPIQWKELPIAGDALDARVARGMRELVAIPGPYVRVFPDAALLRVRTGVGKAVQADDLLYTVIRNRSHTNIDFMFLETDHLVPTEDTLHVVRGIAASRPNLFFDITAADVDGFFAAWKALAPGDGSWGQFTARYGIRRSNPAFWQSSDAFNEAGHRLDPFRFGLVDLSRYIDDSPPSATIP